MSLAHVMAANENQTITSIIFRYLIQLVMPRVETQGSENEEESKQRLWEHGHIHKTIFWNTFRE